MGALLQKYIIFLLLMVLFSCKTSDDSFSAFSPADNIAFNDGTSLYPNPSASDKGWGGAPFKWHIVDGLRTKSNYWNMGLAFTGGLYEYIDTCGWRQATVDFGAPMDFNRVIIWFNSSDLQLLPDSFLIQHRDEETGNWITLKNVSDKRRQLEPVVKDIFKACNRKNLALVVPYEEAFPTVHSSMVRFVFNNCGVDHGWINEFEVYFDRLPVKSVASSSHVLR